jgi:hypothetical protein
VPCAPMFSMQHAATASRNAPPITPQEVLHIVRSFKGRHPSAFDMVTGHLKPLIFFHGVTMVSQRQNLWDVRVDTLSRPEADHHECHVVFGFNEGVRYTGWHEHNIARLENARDSTPN